MANWKRITTAACAAALLVGSLASCGKETTSIDKANPSITIMCESYSVEPANSSSPVVEALQTYLGTKLDFQWTPSSGYGEKVTAVMGAGQYPHVMLLTERNSSVIQNSRNGTFWEIGEKIKDQSKYPNLSQSNDVILNNISIDGKVYGIYRSRTLGRSGVTIRKDWLQKVGKSQPETIDELYEVLKAFRTGDPDGNGQEDTFGMIVTSATSTFDNLAIWFGAPNKWGEVNGELVPAHLTDEYFNALKWMKKVYDEGLINLDFATYDGNKWNEQFVGNKAGVIIDVADRSRRIAQDMDDADGKKVDVFGYVKKDKNTPARALPTSGYKGYFAFPKKSVTSEEDLDFVLTVMDKANDQDALNLMNYGIKDRNYTIDADGFVNVKSEESLAKEYADLNQFSTQIVDINLKKAYASPVAETVEEVYEDNEKYVVANPAEPLVSDTYSRKGPQLDEIITAANTKFIMGQLTEEQYKAELDRWKKQGGDDYIKEINEAYKQIKK